MNTRMLPRVGALLVVLVVCWPALLPAQTFPSFEAKVGVDSGDHYNHGDRRAVVWSKTIRVPGAVWVRLNFQRIVLAEDVEANSGSVLRITSLKDHKRQYLNPLSARQWRNASAYFNGDAVRLDLIAAPNGRLNRVVVDSAEAGEVPAPLFPESICDVIDDRVLSGDVRVARTSGGCTAWLFNDRKHCMLTAGHCAGSASVVFFNVPLSNSDGSYNVPGPDDQYAVDPASMQFINDGVGDDWAYFGVFPNSNTGLTPFEAQGDSFQLELPQPVAPADVIRITGHGTTTTPVDNTWNGAQKTHTGPHLTFSGSALGYRTDTTGGNSGSPVILDNDGSAIGIHTHGGCSSGGEGNNWGTGSNNVSFQTALANPLGVCRDTLEFEYPNGRPALIDPAGGTSVRVQVVSSGATPQPGTGTLWWDDGSGFQSTPMTPVGPNLYDAVFPPTSCGAVVNYYVSADSDSPETFTSPSDAPTTTWSAISATQVQSTFADDFESDTGWTVVSDATDGQWDRGVPVGGGDRGDPPADGDGSGSCYLTDNADGNSDVDGGGTTLTSPLMDASVGANQMAILTYFRWFTNTAGAAPQEDTMVVEISGDGGATWTPLETVGPTGTAVFGGWYRKSFVISDFITPSSQTRIRFTASDLINGSVVEAGVDGVQVQIVDCSTPVVPLASKMLDGFQAGGSLSDVNESDDVYLEIDPNPTANPFKQKIDMIVLQEGVTPTPTSFSIRLESKMSGGPSGDVIQSIELRDQTTSVFEEVDSRPAATGDTVVEVELSGDLSRFVSPLTGEVVARVIYKTESFSGEPFFWSVDVDQMVWLIE